MGLRRKVSEKETACASYRGELVATYGTLCDLFGEADLEPSPDGKTTCEWDMVLDGSVITIYDYCTGVEYYKNRRWMVAGHHSSKAIFEKIADYVNTTEHHDYVYASGEIVQIPGSGS